jgi:hypothetical protein
LATLDRPCQEFGQQHRLTKVAEHVVHSEAECLYLGRLEGPDRNETSPSMRAQILSSCPDPGALVRIELLPAGARHPKLLRKS